MPDDRTSQPPAAGGDHITLDDITNSIAAIGEGAQVIVNKALSAADDAREREEYEQQKLGEAVARHAERLRVQAQVRSATRDAEGTPFRSLLPFELADAGRFFGRGALVEALLRQVLCDDLACRLVVLHGDTGIGKTSLLRAGLLPRLIAGQHLPLVVRVSGTPLAQAVKQTLLPAFADTPTLQTAPLREFLRRVGDLLPEGKRVFVILDQFEAFFEQPQDARQGFIDELAACLYDDDPRDHWLISVRSSWLGHLSIFQPAVQPFASTMVLPPLSRPDARTAITQPAVLSSLTVDEDLLTTLLEDLGGETVDPSRLQIVLSSLVDRLTPQQWASPAGSPQRRLTLKTYQSLGAADGILREYLGSVLSRHFPPEDRENAWRLLDALAERRVNPPNEASLIAFMRGYGLNDADCRRVLALLEANRLVRRGEALELASASLLPRIREWSTSRAAVEQAREETLRQVRSVRASALRGLIGGALGFSLAYLLTFGFQDRFDGQAGLLSFLALYRTLPGGIAGLLLAFAVDVAIASYHGPRRPLRWLIGALGGAGAFALALAFHMLFQSRPGEIAPILLGAVEGALWGAVIGLGAIWLMSRAHRWWIALPVSAAASGLALLAVDQIGGAYGASPLLLLVAGMVAALGVLGALALAPSED